MMALRWYLFVECIKRCRVVPGRTARTFVLLRVHLNWAILLVIDAVWCRHQLTLNYVSKYITMAMTVLQWSSLVGYMERVPCWTNRPYVCIACCVRLNLNVLWLAFDPVCYEVVFSPSLCVVQMHYIIMAITALRRSSLVECMERALCCPCTNSAYVTLLCVLALGCVISERWNMRSQFHPHALFCCPMEMTALCWSLFAERMERISYWP